MLSVAQLLFRNLFDVRLEIEVHKISLVTPEEDVLYMVIHGSIDIVYDVAHYKGKQKPRPDERIMMQIDRVIVNHGLAAADFFRVDYLENKPIGDYRTSLWGYTSQVRRAQEGWKSACLK